VFSKCLPAGLQPKTVAVVRQVAQPPRDIGVREGISVGRRKKFTLKITFCPKNKQVALTLTFLV